MKGPPLFVYAALAGPFWCFFVWASFVDIVPARVWGSDFWEHAAVFHAWFEDLANPQTPHLGGGDGSSRYMPFFFLVTLIALGLNLDAIQATGVAAIINLSLFVVAVPLFANAFFKHRWAAPVTLIILTSAWGIGWLWSNVHQLRDLLYVAHFPSFFVFSSSLLAMWIALRTARAEFSLIAGGIALAILSGLMLMCHPVTAVSAIGSLAVIVWIEPGRPTTGRATLLACIGLGLVATELWPYFSTFDLVLGRHGPDTSSWLTEAELALSTRPSDLLGHHSFYKAPEVPLSLGPTLIGIPVVAYLLWRREQWVIVIGTLVCIGLYLANLIVEIPIGHRFLLSAIFYLQLALIWWLLRFVPNSARLSLNGDRRARVVTWGISVFLVWNVALTAGDWYGRSLSNNLGIFRIHATKLAPLDVIEALAPVVSTGDVILAPCKISWPLGITVAKVVCLHHSNPLVRDERQRREGTEHFFSDRASDSDRRAMIRRFGASHVMFDPQSVSPRVAAMLAELPGNRRLIFDLVLITLRAPNKS
ncbi:MAG: hypothetical protein ACI9W2_005387 [Gammaproteobacteria bacterium]|jgi:hypothetical protein